MSPAEDETHTFKTHTLKQIYTHVHAHIHTSVVFIHTHTHRERERERGRETHIPFTSYLFHLKHLDCKRIETDFQ